MGKIIINYDKHNKTFWQKYWGIILFPLIFIWMLIRDNGFAGYLDIDGRATYKLKYKKNQHPQVIEIPAGAHRIIYRKRSKFFGWLNSSQPVWARPLDKTGVYDNLKLDYITLDFGPETELTLSAIGGSLKECVITELTGLPEEKAESAQPTALLPQKKGCFPVIAVLIILLLLGCIGFLLTTKIDLGFSLSDLLPSVASTEASESITEEYGAESEEASAPLILGEAREMYVVADGGLRLRTKPDTNSNVITLIPTNTKIQVYTTENGWAYVTYNNENGWCSVDYLFDTIEATEPTEAYSDDTDIVNKGIERANKIMKNYASVKAKGALTSAKPTDDEILDLFKRAQYIEIYQSFSVLSNIFSRVEGGTSYMQQTPYGEFLEWYEAYSNKYPDIEAFCDEYYSCFTNDLAYLYLENDIALIDNKIHIFLPGGIGDEGVKHEFLYEVEKTATGYNVKVTGNYYRDLDDENLITNTEIFNFPLEKEDGAWVFTHMEWLPT